MEQQVLKALLSILILLSLANQSSSYGQTAQDPDRQMLVNASNQFSLDLYKILAKDSGNVVASPFSVHSILTMLYLGARGETADTMESVLHLKPIRNCVTSAVSDLSNSFVEVQQKDTANELSNSVAMWANRNYPVRADYASVLRGCLNADAQNMNFSDTKGIEESRKTINQWISERSHGRFPEILEKNELSSLTILLLTTVLWFDGKWEYPFKPGKTYPSEYYPLQGKRIQVPTMFLHVKEGYPFRVLQSPDYKVLEMPYQGKFYSMFIVLPRERYGLPELEATLDTAQVSEWIRNAYTPSEGLQISLPKLTFTWKKDLNDPLQTMGLSNLYSLSDLSGIYDKTTGLLEDVKQEVKQFARIELDEQGTIVVAVTKLAMTVIGGSGSDEFCFYADHPFLFLIRDNTTGAILFMGHVTDPSKQ